MSLALSSAARTRASMGAGLRITSWTFGIARSIALRGVGAARAPVAKARSGRVKVDGRMVAVLNVILRVPASISDVVAELSLYVPVFAV